MASITDKGTQIMEGLLLSQYVDSPNLIQYIKAYVEEMDELFCAIEDVYFGRFLDTAVGVQLDIIGEILGQNRNVDLAAIYFGFQGVTGVGGFGSDAAPLSGGIFKSADTSGANITPLSDSVYRRLLRCKANTMNKASISIEDMYTSICTLLGKVPVKMIITEPSSVALQLELDAATTRDEDQQLLYYGAQFYVPAGVTFNIIQT